MKAAPKRRIRRIDGIAAIIMAVSRLMVAEGPSVYEQWVNLALTGCLTREASASYRVRSRWHRPFNLRRPYPNREHSGSPNFEAKSVRKLRWTISEGASPDDPIVNFG